MKRWPLCIGLLVVLTGCSVLTRVRPDYKELPVDSLREVALEIEQAVQAGNRTPNIEDRDGIVVNTDAIRETIRTRAARVELVNELLNTGHCWERRDGHLWVIRSAEYKRFGNKRSRNRNALIVYGETQNRWDIYEGILDESDFRQRSLKTIQQVFFEARIQCMSEGQKYEGEDDEQHLIGE